MTSATMTGTALVLHGHFYQPPREDPWTGVVPEQPGAAPYHDWNERITDECYRPNAELGTFEQLSFNVGPTLLSWLQAHHGDVYARIIDADRATGRAIAQAYGHAILPLCNERDVRTHVRWGIVDFEHRFGRRPEGMWLPETAVNDFVLRVLAEEGIRFTITILAPGQIDAPDLPRSGCYRWRDPDGGQRTVDLVVYDAGLAHALAFEAPTSQGIVDAALDIGGLVVAATDGETFGHHHDGADEVVSAALTITAPELGVRVPRLLDVLDEAVREGELPEVRVRTSAWSCAHGVERWKADCGCHTGGQEGWDQAWRAPLRHALDVLRDWGIEAFERRACDLLRDPWAARDDYLGLLIGACGWEDFAGRHIVGDGHRAGVLLDAQRNAVLMYTSCGWFFNDLAGIETIQVLQYAARAIDLYEQLGEQPPVDEVLEILAEARSNDPAQGTGRDLWHTQVVP
jgi:alpha-amylase/alpha-mannosidase (GH57 family)